MADTYNLAHESARRRASIVPSRCTGLHVADEPRASHVPGVRVLPGEGDGSAGRVVQALRRAGWDGTLDVEIFSTPDAFWSLPVDEAARRAYAAARASGLSRRGRGPTSACSSREPDAVARTADAQ